ncbi:putative amine oxidase [copper-containing] [Saccostrea cucullata]|uniref:putative amine oxidase [copper-containing] n=1 Tax=Saccostrea cuccullata TaxID=36930 RepID=UPI002ED1B60D
MSRDGYTIGEKSTSKTTDPRFWQCLALVLGVIALVLLIVVIVLAANKEKEDTNIPECKRLPVSGVIDITEPEKPPIFHDLTRGEIRIIFDFMLSQKSLNLSQPSKAVLASNYIYAMELILPEKKFVLQSTQQSPPIRKALVTVFCGGKAEPNVEEYCVELTQQLSFCGGPRSIPFSFRPFTIPEYMSALNVVTEDANRIVGDILLESFKGSFFQCGGNCLGVENITPYAAMIAEVEGKGYRGLWFPFLQLMEPKNLHPVDFAVLVTFNGSAVPETADVWYNGQSFASLQDFKDKWDKGEVSKLILDFPQMRTHDKKFPENMQRPPIEIEPDGRRYYIKDQTVTYMNWMFHYGISPSHGPQLYNIRFKNEMIVYELGLQEICVFYSSSEPAGRFTNYFDSVVMIGLYMKTLVPGIDCPSHATFLDATHMFETSDSPVTNKRAICVFEHNTGSPLRRHHAASETPSGYYEGAPNVVLILRMIGTLVNYDYIFDFIFYQNGVMETKVTASGIIISSFKSTDKKYGFQLTDQALGTLHYHFFNFKVDLDIGGSNNSYSTYEVEADEVPNPFSKASNPSNWHQEKVVKVDYATEREAAYKFNFSSPKYHVFYNENNKDKYGNPKAYRILQKSMAKNVRTQGAGNEPGSPWTRYQMVVTKRKETEPHSSSKYATYDGENRTVDFEDFIGEENINGEDLVAWVTMGVHHIPHSEDLPIMPTPGTDLSFLLLPFNYFPEDPSVGFNDNVRIQYDTPTGPLKIKKAKTSELNCLPPKTYSVEDLMGHPEDFINRP